MPLIVVCQVVMVMKRKLTEEWALQRILDAPLRGGFCCAKCNEIVDLFIKE